MRDYWTVLGLDEHATEQELKARYRHLVKQWHPDRFADDPRRQAIADANLKIINLAYRAIRNHRRRPHAVDGSETSEPRSTDWLPTRLFQSEVMLTYLPLIVFAIFCARHSRIMHPAVFPTAVSMLIMTWSIMVWDVSHNQRIPANRRVLWIILLVAVAAVSVPVYFQRYGRSPAA